MVSRTKPNPSASSGSERSSLTAAGRLGSKRTTPGKTSGAFVSPPRPKPSILYFWCYNPWQERGQFRVPELASCKGISVWQGGKHRKRDALGSASLPGSCLWHYHPRPEHLADLLQHPVQQCV